MSSKPTPFTLILVTEGVNHSLQFGSSGRGVAAYRQIKDKMGTLALDAVERPHEIVDDFGATVVVYPSKIRSARLTDVCAEHRAAMDLKLAELYAAHAFEEMVKTEHAGLTIVKARNPSLIRPQ